MYDQSNNGKLIVTSQESEGGLSLKAVFWLMLLLALGITWGLAANAYATDVMGVVPSGPGGARSALARSLVYFCINAVVQLANLPGVIGHTCSEKSWILVTGAVLVGLVVGGYFILMKVDAELNAKPKRRR